MAREYRSALALEQAVKAAAKRSGQDVGRAVEGFYAGRLLERVFSEERKPFVLKGGRGILARTIDARYTTDTDFLYRGDDLEARPSRSSSASPQRTSATAWSSALSRWIG